MSQTIWTAGSGWTGIGTATITSPNTYAASTTTPVNPSNNGGSILPVQSSQLPASKQFYLEFDLSDGISAPLGYLYTAFELGIGTGDGINFADTYPGNNDTGAGVAYPSGAITGIMFSYNKGLSIQNGAGSYVIDRVAGNPAPNFWASGGVVGVDVDLIGMNVQFYYNGSAVWGNTTVAGLGNAALYLLAITWNGGQPILKINDGTYSFAHGSQKGYQSLLAANTAAPPPPSGQTISILSATQ